MKPAVASQYVLVERAKPAPLALVFLAVLCTAAGFLIGDWTADGRFDAREESLLRSITSARIDAERIRNSIKQGCYEHIDPDRPYTSQFRHAKEAER